MSAGIVAIASFDGASAAYERHRGRAALERATAGAARRRRMRAERARKRGRRRSEEDRGGDGRRPCCVRPPQHSGDRDGLMKREQDSVMASIQAEEGRERRGGGGEGDERSNLSFGFAATLPSPLRLWLRLKQRDRDTKAERFCPSLPLSLSLPRVLSHRGGCRSLEKERQWLKILGVSGLGLPSSVLACAPSGYTAGNGLEWPQRRGSTLGGRDGAARKRGEEEERKEREEQTQGETGRWYLYV